MFRHYTVNDLPPGERPRERLSASGAESLSLVELLMVIMGRGTAGESVIEIARHLVARYPSARELSEASLEDLRAVPGIGPAKAAQLKACFELSRRLEHEHALHERGYKRNPVLTDAAAIHLHLLPFVRNRKKEHFFLLSFDTRNRLIGVDTVSVGSLNASLVHPRELFDLAIRRHAAYVIVSHNHPSGDADPSDEDIAVTRRLADSGKILGIRVVDHIIVCHDCYYSFHEHGMIS